MAGSSGHSRKDHANSPNLNIQTQLDKGRRRITKRSRARITTPSFGRGTEKAESPILERVDLIKKRAQPGRTATYLRFAVIWISSGGSIGNRRTII
jgi:hypothetical protein